jgi:hypothetical protein
MFNFVIYFIGSPDVSEICSYFLSENIFVTPVMKKQKREIEVETNNAATDFVQGPWSASVVC